MKKIKFVSYDGVYPNLCSGTLKLDVDGQQINLESCLCSGGNVSWMEEDITHGPWTVMKHKLPNNLRKYKKTIERIVNENVPWGCCGGCI